MIEACGNNGALKTDENIITIGKLVKRWVGAKDGEIVELEKEGQLIPYSRVKTWLTQENRKLHYLEPTWLVESQFWQGDGFCYSFRECVFFESNIQEIEKEHPEFLWQQLDDEKLENADNQYPDLLPLNNLYIEKDSFIAAKEKGNSPPDTGIEELREASREASADDCQGFFERYPICGLIRDLDMRGMDRDQVRMELQKLTDYNLATLSFLTNSSASYRSGAALKKSFHRSKERSVSRK